MKMGFLEEAAAKEAERFEANSAKFLEEVKRISRIMLEKKNKVDKLTEELAEATKQYRQYREQIIPPQMKKIGIESVGVDGNIIELTQEIHCSPNKNEADRKILIDWLNQQGGEYLVKTTYFVDKATAEVLKEEGKNVAEVKDISTSSLKVFISNLTGYKGIPAKISLEDVPDVAHFVVMDVVTVKTK